MALRHRPTVLVVVIGIIVSNACSYGRMYQSFQKLVMVYETEPDNFPRLMELMQDVGA